MLVALWVAHTVHNPTNTTFFRAIHGVVRFLYPNAFPRLTAAAFCDAWTMLVQGVSPLHSLVLVQRRAAARMLRRAGDKIV